MDPRLRGDDEPLKTYLHAQLQTATWQRHTSWRGLRKDAGGGIRKCVGSIAQFGKPECSANGGFLIVTKASRPKRIASGDGLIGGHAVLRGTAVGTQTHLPTVL